MARPARGMAKNRVMPMRITEAGIAVICRGP